MISSFRIPHSSCEQISLPASGTNGTRVTVLIGENGTRKSLILRELALAALAKMSAVDSSSAQDERAVFEGVPGRVIAISATATDRFPAKSRLGRFGRSRRFDTPEYVYIGPRTADNIVSRNHGVRELLHGVLRDPQRLKNKREYLSDVARFVGVPSSLSVGLHTRPRPSVSSRNAISFSDYLSGLGESGARLGRELDVFRASVPEGVIRELDSIEINTPTLKGNRRFSEIEVRIHLETGDIIAPVTTEALFWAFDTGYLAAGRIQFGEMDQDGLSAGQWSILSVALSLAIVSQPDSLVLIDEPENGLHPAWQRRYLRIIENALHGQAGCHVIVATHSPLILGALPRESDVVVLRRTANGEQVDHELTHAPTGWEAGAVLEDVFMMDSTRDPSTTDLINSALALVAKGHKQHRQKLSRLMPRLEEIAEGLPSDDILVQAIASIRELVAEGASS